MRIRALVILLMIISHLQIPSSSNSFFPFFFLISFQTFRSYCTNLKPYLKNLYNSSLNLRIHKLLIKIINFLIINLFAWNETSLISWSPFLIIHQNPSFTVWIYNGGVLDSFFLSFLFLSFCVLCSHTCLVSLRRQSAINPNRNWRNSSPVPSPTLP